MDKEPSGIGGWLVLPFIGLVLTPLVTAYSVWNEVLPSLREPVWSTLTTPGSPVYHALWAPFMIGSLAANVILIVAALVLLVIGAQKRRIFPKLMIGFYVFSLLCAGIDVAGLNGFVSTIAPEAAAEALPAAYKTLVRALIVCLIWCSYFAVSKRVRNTFVR